MQQGPGARGTAAGGAPVWPWTLAFAVQTLALAQAAAVGAWMATSAADALLALCEVEIEEEGRLWNHGPRAD